MLSRRSWRYFLRPLHISAGGWSSKLSCPIISFDLVPLFFIFSQKFEAKEKESAAAMPVKKGVGKGKVVKVKQETLPTPQGRRVVPRVTSAMKAEANKKADKKGEAKRGKKVKVRRQGCGGGFSAPVWSGLKPNLNFCVTVYLQPPRRHQKSDFFFLQ